MTYNITLTNGSQLVTIANGSVDVDHSSLSLVGKNFTGYGKMMNENFVHLLENFSNNVEPLNPLVGQLWYDSGQKVIKVRTQHNTWKNIGSAHAGESPPQNPIIGDQWWDTNELKLKGWTGSLWLVIGPTAAGSGDSGSSARGPIGYTGSRGEAGEPGPSGAKGNPGDPGTPGPIGPRGYIGYTGSIGATGPIATIIPEDIVVNGVHFGKGLNSRTHNTRAGADALKLVTSGDFNSSFGSQSLKTNTTGSYNTAIGYANLESNSTGSNNIAIGINSLKYNASGNQNIGIGEQALFTNTSGGNNVAIGSFALYSNVGGGQAPTNSSHYFGYHNVAVGGATLLRNTSGYLNTVIGHYALVENTEGKFNVAAGHASLVNNTTGSDNVAVGVSSGGNATTGVKNTFVGPAAGVAITTGSKNVVIGGNSGNDIKTSNNNIILSDGDGNIRAQCDAIGNWVFSSISASNVSELLKKIYPIGCIYTSTVNENPSVTFGFGTWSAFGAGRVLIGAGAGFTAGQTGGSADAVAVWHTHGLSDPGHSHSYERYSAQYPQSGSSTHCWAGVSTVSTARATTGITISGAGEDGTGKNMQPYIVVHMWLRTA